MKHGDAAFANFLTDANIINNPANQLKRKAHQSLN